MSEPFVSVIIVNYNGARYLSRCLEGLRRQTYPKDCFEVIISDNGSTDGSIELLQKDYPWVKLLENKQNLGFSTGNNVAIEASRGKYVVLLNNDTVPTPSWLSNFVAVAEEHSEVGIITGRLQLFYDQLIMKLETETFIPPLDGRVLGIQLFNVDSGVERGVVQYLEGFYGVENHPSGNSFRWTKGRAQLGIPVPLGADSWVITLCMAAAGWEERFVNVKVSVHDDQISNFEVSGVTPHDYQVNLPANVRSLAKPLLQNTGAIVFPNAMTRDRGTYISGTEVFFEVDEGQYNQIEEVFSGCGANMLIRCKMLDEVGAFDDDFFMYYEDTDLSWRARLFGWKVLYSPNAVVRHIHCGTAEEWSPFFIYHVERNHIAMVFKNGSPSQILNTCLRYMGGFAKNILMILNALLRRGDWRHHVKQSLLKGKVIKSLIGWLPALWRKRHQIQIGRTLSATEIGYWFAK